MSGDEVLITMASVYLTLWLWPRWILSIASVTHIGPYPPCRRMPLYLTPAFCMLLLLAILLAAASPDVRNSPQYLFMYMAMGSAWLATMLRLFPFLNLDIIGDCVSRRNRAALYPSVAAMAGITLTFAGANIGSGPGWWVVVFCAVLASGGLLTFWFLLELLAAPSESITVNRDNFAGIRMASYLLSEAILLARSGAGDWVSTSRTIHDFATQTTACWALLLLATVTERVAARSRLPAWTAIIATAVYPVAAIAVVTSEGLPK